jgi:hypothetical protein
MIIKLLIFWWFLASFKFRIPYLELRIRIRQKVSDPYRFGSGSPPLVISDPELWDFSMNADLDPRILSKSKDQDPTFINQGLDPIPC